MTIQEIRHLLTLATMCVFSDLGNPLARKNPTLGLAQNISTAEPSWWISCRKWASWIHTEHRCARGEKRSKGLENAIRWTRAMNRYMQAIEFGKMRRAVAKPDRKGVQTRRASPPLFGQRWRERKFPLYFFREPRTPPFSTPLLSRVPRWKCAHERVCSRPLHSLYIFSRIVQCGHRICQV